MKNEASTLTARMRSGAESLVLNLQLSSQEARLEARVLAAHALGVNRTWLIAHDRDVLSAEQLAAVESLIQRRCTGEPVAYILGKRDFYSRTFKVTPATLIPRPETEHLVDAALMRLREQQDKPGDVLDIGAGSGCIAITLKLEFPAAKVVAVDISPDALAAAHENAQRLHAEVTFLLSDLFSALDDRRFDLVVSNPPYIAAGDSHLKQGDLRFEPTGALTSGDTGLDAIRQIIAQAPAHLKPGGWLLLEHGWDQAEVVASLLARAGFNAVFMERDLAGQARVSGGRIENR